MNSNGNAAAKPLMIVRCPTPGCGRRLFDGEMTGEIKCRSCKRVIKFLAKKESPEYPLQKVAR